jgi:hypothetical protein
LTVAELGSWSYRRDRYGVQFKSLSPGHIKIHKLDLLVELKETVMNQLHSIQLLKSSHPVMLAPVDVGARVARVAIPDNQGVRP